MNKSEKQLSNNPYFFGADYVKAKKIMDLLELSDIKNVRLQWKCSS